MGTLISRLWETDATAHWDTGANIADTSIVIPIQTRDTNVNIGGSDAAGIQHQFPKVLSIRMLSITMLTSVSTCPCVSQC